MNPNEIAREAAEEIWRLQTGGAHIDAPSIIEPIILSAITRATEACENQAQGLAHVLNDMVTLWKKHVVELGNVKPSVQSTIAIADIQLKAFWRGERGTIDLKSRAAPASAEQQDTEQSQESFKPFFKSVEGKSDAELESIIGSEQQQEWVVNYHELITPIGNLYVIEDDHKTAATPAKRLKDEIDAALTAECKQGNFARVQEQAKQLSELREAIMGGTGAIATHEQLLEKVAAERQRTFEAQQAALREGIRSGEIKQRLLSALAAFKKLQDE